MSYKSNAERERENWITLPEAVTRICSTDGCDERDARRQLLKALTDGVLGPLRWEREKDDKPPPFGYTPLVVPSDTPPSGRDWLKAKVRWRTGTVRDDWGEYKNGKWRIALILRSKVAQYWPSEAEGAITTAGQESAAIKALKLHLETNKQMMRGEAEQWCKAAGYSLGKRAFARVWPEARERAGLERIAAPGRKKSSR